jgi:hypothetical protein
MFVQTDKGYINIAAVSRVGFGTEGRAFLHAGFGADEIFIGTVENPLHAFWDSYPFQCIKADPATYLLSWVIEEDGSQTSYKRQVIAWRLDQRGDPSPITADNIYRESTDGTAVLFPDGHVEEVGGDGMFWDNQSDYEQHHQKLLAKKKAAA